ncbi:MAG: hypothetical protein IPH23_00295 [Gammaproteobacteria bacterium]|nr:hypothetical protein [Gammaproteobacteria bacterium]
MVGVSPSTMVAVPTSLTGGVPLLFSVPVRVKVSSALSTPSATVSVRTSSVLSPAATAIGPLTAVQLVPPSVLYSNRASL